MPSNAVFDAVPAGSCWRDRPRRSGNAAQRAVVQVVVVAGSAVAVVAVATRVRHGHIRRRRGLGAACCVIRLRGCRFVAIVMLWRCERCAGQGRAVPGVQHAQRARHGGRQREPQHRDQRDPSEPAQGLAGWRHRADCNKKNWGGIDRAKAHITRSPIDATASPGSNAPTRDGLASYSCLMRVLLNAGRCRRDDGCVHATGQRAPRFTRRSCSGVQRWRSGGRECPGADLVRRQRGFGAANGRVAAWQRQRGASRRRQLERRHLQRTPGAMAAMVALLRCRRRRVGRGGPRAHPLRTPQCAHLHPAVIAGAAQRRHDRRDKGAEQQYAGGEPGQEGTMNAVGSHAPIVGELGRHRENHVRDWTPRMGGGSALPRSAHYAMRFVKRAVARRCAVRSPAVRDPHETRDVARAGQRRRRSCGRSGAGGRPRFRP